MSDEDYGRSYWEIVTRSFSRNWVARAALWVSGGMLLIAIFTPFIANNRPYLFKGTLPREYRRSWLISTGPGPLAVLNTPRSLAAEAERFQKGEATQQNLLQRSTDEEAGRLLPSFERLRKVAEARPEIRARWITQEITLGEMLAEMTPAERKILDEVTARVIRDLPAAHRDTLPGRIDAVRLHIRRLEDQLDGPAREKAREFERRFLELMGGDLLAEDPDRRAKVTALMAEMKSALKPDSVQLVSKWRFPLIDALGPLDVLFVVGALAFLLAFGPLKWTRLKGVQPIERRWKISWTIAAVPALAAAALWLLFHSPTFDTVDYKAALAEPEGDKSVVIEAALWPPHRYAYDEVPATATGKLQGPSLAHPFGTDFMGRDLLARMMWGARVSLSIGFVSAGIAAIIGIMLGAIAGYFRGYADMTLSRIIEIMLCFPTFFLILAVVAFLPPSLYFVMLVLGLFGWMGIARLQRGEFFRLVNQDFVQAARALGVSPGRIMFRHILPNALGPVLVAVSFAIATAMLTESALSFLGLGVPPPETSWGEILFASREQVTSGAKYWWTFIIPGGAIFIAVTCYNLVGDGIRDAVDPRLKL